MTIPAGWYDDGSGRRRWWDGSAWTQHTLSAPAREESTPAPAREESTPAPAREESADAAFTAPWVSPGAASVDGPAGAARGEHSPHPMPATAPVWSTAAPQPAWGGVPTAAEPTRARGVPVLGFVALAVAVLGAVLACIPGIGVVGALLLGAGFVIGIVSLFLRAPKWPGAAGMGVSVLGAFLAVAVTLISVGSIGVPATPEAGDAPITTPGTPPPDAEPGTAPEDAESVAWSDIEVGQCMPYVETEGDVYYVPVVPCDQPHSEEVYFAFDLDDGEYPGDDELARTADDRCLAEFESFVGYSYADSELDFYWSVPTQRTWRWGDREIICILFSYEDVTDTLQGAAR